MTLRPRRLVMWSCVVWVVTMAVLVFSGSIWASYERQDMMSRKRTSFSPVPQVKQSSHTNEPVKSGTVSQTFRGGAAWKDTLPIYAIGTGLSGGLAANPNTDQAGIKPGRHLEAFVWHPHYLAAQHLCDVHVRLIAEVVRAESAGNPWALSTAGARGLMQVKPSTAAELGDFDLWNPAQNLIVGSCYLRRQFDRFGSWRKALHAYHAGANRTRTSSATLAYAADIIQGSAQ